VNVFILLLDKDFNSGNGKGLGEGGAKNDELPTKPELEQKPFSFFQNYKK
jgi:hypothetical protein